MLDVSHPYFDSGLSWLSYTHRLLMEASDESVPLVERLRFLGRFAKEKDEFIKEKIPFNRAMTLASRDTLDKLNLYPETLLEHIRETLASQFQEFTHILTNSILPALREGGANLIFKTPFRQAHHEFLTNYFMKEVFRHIQPVFLNSRKSLKNIFPEPTVFHLIVRLYKDLHAESSSGDTEEFLYACVNIPVTHTSRFVELPDLDNMKQIAFLEDVIRFNLDLIFPGYVVHDCYTIRSEKPTHPELEDELIPLYATRVAKQLEKQGFVTPQFVFHEEGMPDSLLHFLSERFDIPLDEWIEKGAYLNYSDLADFPKLGKRLEYPVLQQLSAIRQSENIFEILSQEDQLLHLPYHSHWPILKFFNDAAIDPHVREIHVSLYKISGQSFLVNSLISAARNGKKVTAFVELNPKLTDHESPIWAKKMKDAGIKVYFSTPGLKVHAKIALIKRKVKKGWERYAYLGTGGFYRLTAAESTDHVLLTTHSEICNELELLFAYLATGQEAKKFKYLPFNFLHVSQFNMHRKLIELIDREIQHSKMGKKAAIAIKINQLQDKQLVDKLYHASRVGVSVAIIVTNGLSLIPDLPTISENITVMRIVDRFKENSRLFYFHNDGKEDLLLSSADWTHRNFHRRIDVTFPILDRGFKRTLIQMLENYLNDNQKAVRLDVYQNNVRLRSTTVSTKIRAQEANQKLIERQDLKTAVR
jgi:polyphosphate kinase